VSYQPAFDEIGEVVGVSCAVTDFTTRKAAEDRLRQYERLVEGLDEMVAVVDRNYRYVLTNRAFLEVFGGANAKLEGRQIRHSIEKDVFERILKPNLDRCFYGNPVHFSMEYDLPGIGVRNLSVAYSPIEVSGKVDTVACVVRDITEMKRIELAQCTGSRIGLWDWDIAANTVVWSDESYRQWGFRRDTFSRNVADAVPRIHPADRAFVESAIQKVIARETDEYAAQYRVLRPDGSICWIDARGVMLGDAFQRMIGIGIDITDQMKTQDPTSHSASDPYC
jgi:PAS domain S-box-containing protein